MILHLLSDEKITPRIIKTFDTVFKEQNYYIFWRHNSYSPHFAYESDRCQIYSDNFLPNFEVSKISKVVIHGLDRDRINFCSKYLSKDMPIYWILWGAELYNSLLSKRGYKLYYNYQPKISFKGQVNSFLRKFGFMLKSERTFLDFFKNNNVTMVCAQEEYDLLRKYYPRHTETLNHRSEFFYYPIDEILGEALKKQEAKGKIILVGNSASWTNNHDYVFSFLKQLDLKDKKVVTPLNYGGNNEYRRMVADKGTEIFGTSYEPLFEYLPLQEYNVLMAQSEICIYGSWRQEAMGNILVALYMGSKVFLSQKNPLYKILKNKGLIVYSLERINQIELDTPLSKEEKEGNRRLLSETNSWNKLQQVTYELFK